MYQKFPVIGEVSCNRLDTYVPEVFSPCLSQENKVFSTCLDTVGICGVLYLITNNTVYIISEGFSSDRGTRTQAEQSSKVACTQVSKYLCMHLN
jgi:hypothetical protein